MNTHAKGKGGGRLHNQVIRNQVIFLAVNLIGFSSSARKTLRFACCTMCTETAALTEEVGGSKTEHIAK